MATTDSASPLTVDALRSRRNEASLGGVTTSASRSVAALAAMALALAAPLPAAAWEPTKPVEFIVPAGTGGGADQMARFSRAWSPRTT